MPPYPPMLCKTLCKIFGAGFNRSFLQLAAEEEKGCFCSRVDGEEADLVGAQAHMHT